MFKKCFKYVRAAGGVAALPDGRVLIIKRFGKWDLPKGMVEKGESMQDTAVREVMEECGLEKAPNITGKLKHTFHTYRKDGLFILKRTTWYAMLYDGNESLQPQYDEDITEALWVPQNRMDFVMQNTYKSIKKMLSRVKSEE